MTDRDYAIKSMKEITFQMASHAQDYLENTMKKQYEDMAYALSYLDIYSKQLNDLNHRWVWERSR